MKINLRLVGLEIIKSKTMENKLKVKVRLEEGATMPTRAHNTDSGYDMHVNTVTVSGGMFGLRNKLTSAVTGLLNKDSKIGKGINDALHSDLAEKFTLPNVVIIDTGVSVQPPEGYYFEGYANSRSAKRGYILGNCVGVIDQGYTGTIKYIYKIMPWCSREDYERLIEHGSVCGQIILKKRLDAELVKVDKLDSTERGAGGFGSTEKKTK